MKSPVQILKYLGRDFYIKRDDLAGANINGNKFRKLLFLSKTKPADLKEIISWGGCQSNAMYALSYLCKAKGWKFTYYCRTMPNWLKKQPHGNLQAALANGMVLAETGATEYRQTVELLQEQLRSHPKKQSKTAIIPMGAASPQAEAGLQELAAEVKDQMRPLKVKNFDIFLSSGTGTSAYFLAKNTQAPVFTVPCAGSSEYLSSQMSEFGSPPANLVIVKPPISLPFAAPHPELLQTYEELKQAGLEFDLIYDSMAWLYIKKNLASLKDRNILFIHSGGIHSNESQLKRYNRNTKNAKTPALV